MLLGLLKSLTVRLRGTSILYRAPLIFSLKMLSQWRSKKMPDVPLGDAVRARLQQFAAMNKLKKKALRVGFTACW